MFITHQLDCWAYFILPYNLDETGNINELTNYNETERL